METDNNIQVKYNFDYLKLAVTITKLRYQGDEPPKEIYKQAYDLGRLAGISEEELKNL